MSKNSERVKAWMRKNPERARAMRFKTNNGVDLAQLPPYPGNGTCQFCGYQPTRKRLHWDHDHEMEAMGFNLADCHRGWICYGCNSMFGRVEKIGVEKAVNYLKGPRR
jgi:Recombination endonuclease VII